MSRQDHFLLSEVTADLESAGDDDILLQVNLRLHLDEVAEIEAERLLPDARRAPTKNELCLLAGKMYDARRVRDRMLHDGLFGEPAWDMLLALYCLPARGELLTVSALCYASGVPPTTALRWQKALMAQGFIERGPDGVDGRKQIVRLTQQGRAALEKYLARLFYCGVPVPP